MNVRAPRWNRHAFPLAGRLHLRARWDEGCLIGICDPERDGLLRPRG